MKFFFYLLMMISPLLASVPQWIREQVKEDLSPTPHASIRRRDLRSLFNEYDKLGRQALYCRIKKNKVTWKKTAQSDPWRNPHIFNYLKKLSRRFTLPDTEFILLTDDGTDSPQPLPVFAFSKHRNAKNVCLFPDFEMLWELADQKKNWIPICQRYATQFPWETKERRAFFRGVATGGHNSTLYDFGNDRLRLTIFSHHHPELVDATLAQVYDSDFEQLLASIGKEIARANIETHFQYKYLFDVDGNASTYSRCRWILLSNSVLLKMMSGYTQWYYKALRPFVHFVPIKQDLSDLIDTMDFLKTHDSEAQQIAEQGRALGIEIFSYKRVDEYVMTLLKEYKRRLRK